MTDSYKNYHDLESLYATRRKLEYDIDVLTGANKNFTMTITSSWKAGCRDEEHVATATIHSNEIGKDHILEILKIKWQQTVDEIDKYQIIKEE